jgi:hypothetical protein
MQPRLRYGPQPPPLCRAVCVIVVWVTVAFLYTHPHRHYDPETVTAISESLRARWTPAAEPYAYEYVPAHGPSPTRSPTTKLAAAAPPLAPAAGAIAGLKMIACVGVEVDDGFGRLQGGPAVPADAPVLTACAAKAACRRMGPGACAAFARAPDGRSVFASRAELRAAVASTGGDGVLSVALYGHRGDFLRAALDRWDATPRVQIRSSHDVDAFHEKWSRDGAPPVFGGPNRSTTHYSRDGGLPVRRRRPLPPPPPPRARPLPGRRPVTVGIVRCRDAPRGALD